MKFFKTAFWGFTPFTVKNKKELSSGKGYMKEYGNRAISTLPGALAGGLAVGLPAALITNYATGGDSAATTMASEIGGYVGGAVGGLTADVKAIRKTEREAGVKQTGAKKYIARHLAGQAAGIIPGVGMVTGPLADYGVSRKLMDYESVSSRKKK